MKAFIPALVFIAVLLLIDLYAFKALKLVTSGWQRASWRTALHATYWITSVGAHIMVLYAFLTYRQAQENIDYFFFFMGFGILLMLFIPKLIVVVFHLVDDLLHLFRRVATWFIQSEQPEMRGGGALTRWQFLTRIGWVLAAIPFIGIVYGMARGRYQFRVERETLRFSHLPEGFHGLKIVHISDIHIGSFFNNHEAVQRGIDMINALEPDVVCFTGDMVNNYAAELDGWIPMLSQIKARYGKYSVLGNHDYGDYVPWPDAETKSRNLEALKQKHREMGFRLLLNEREILSGQDGGVIEILGIENWGLGGFSQYGKLQEAMRGSDPSRFQLLLSHDPSHWDAEVRSKTSIDLALAGHTHGMQFGVEIPGIVKWSPVKYRYPRWGGLYREGSQCLYVNRGFGYIGFPGRVGMPPEITLLELHRA
jgi:predicted MPP superfamily phosphohydrolase